MASSKEKMEKSFQKIQKKIQSNLKKAPRKIKTQSQQISAQISAQIADRLGERLTSQLNAVLSSKVSEQAQEAVKTATRTAQATAELVSETARHGIDQVLLNLEHRGVNVKESQDLAVKVGRKVLERAEAIREQIAANPFSPSWLKDVSLKPLETNPRAASAPVTGSDVETAVASATAVEGMEPRQAPLDAHEKTDLEESEAESEHAPKKARRAPKKSTTGAVRATK